MENPKDNSEKTLKPAGLLGERMSNISTMMIKRDGVWVWLDNGEEVKNNKEPIPPNPIDSLSTGQAATAFTDRMQEFGGVKVIKKNESAE